MKSSLLAFLAGASPALAAVRGFNYGSQGQTYDTYASQFKTAAALAGATDFTSARLYTMIEAGTTDTPITAIQAAIDTNTTLLLGLWASGDTFSNEITALQSAIQQYGSDLANLVTGISVGSEDLYRISATGIANNDGVGQSPDVLVSYIAQVRSTIKGTPLASAPVGHVDTWNVYVNSSNDAVILACDWLGLDEYPYYQTTDTNTIEDAGFLFFQAYDRVAAAAQGKPIWITESGWPVSGPTSNLAVASTSNAADYWQTVACALEHRDINFWWYILEDAGTSPSFGVSNNGTPLYNLACNASAGYTSATASASAASTSTKSGSSAHSTSAGGSIAATQTTASAQVTVAGGSTVTVSTSTSAFSFVGTTSSATQPQVTNSGSTSGSATGSSFSQPTGAATKAEATILGLTLVAVVAALAL